MTEEKKTPVEIPEQLVEVLVAGWLQGEIPYELRNAVVDNVSRRVRKSAIIDEIAELAEKKLADRKEEIAEILVVNIVQGVGKNLGGIYKEIMEKALEKVKNDSRYW